MKIVIVVLQLSSMLLVGCSGMSYDRYGENKWLAKIYSNPPGAEIFVDGVSVGTAPLEYSYPSIGMSQKEVVAKFPSGNEQSLTTGYYVFEVLFDFIHNKARVKEYPEAFSFYAKTREVSFDNSVPLSPEMRRHALPAEKLRALLPAGEEREPKSQPRPPDIEVGALIDILKVETGSEKVKVIADSEGQAHVLVSSEKLQKVLEIIVGPDGVVNRRVIRSGPIPNSIDGAFDAQGRLHVLLDTEHLILKDQEWQASSQTPWHESGLKVGDMRFVPNAPDLIWVFQVNGADIDTPLRTDFYFIGGYGGGIILPWFTHGSRAVLVSENSGGYGPWFVLDPQRKESTYATNFTSDRQANVYIIYERQGGTSDANVSYYYSFIDSRILRDNEVSIPGVTEIQSGSRRIRAFEKGNSGLVQQGPGGEIDKQVAADPESGTALVGMRYLVRGKTWSAPIDSPFSSKVFRVGLVPGGQDSFHALVVGKPLHPWRGKNFPVQYLMFSAGAWSAPIELGHADTFRGGNVMDAAGIAAVGMNSAFLIWPTEQGIVGTWIQRSK
jgi:hypothetical protein